jgi:hypothetical protein
MTVAMPTKPATALHLNQGVDLTDVTVTAAFGSPQVPGTSMRRMNWQACWSRARKPCCTFGRRPMADTSPRRCKRAMEMGYVAANTALANIYWSDGDLTAAKVLYFKAVLAGDLAAVRAAGMRTAG